jgi:multidrug efflux pump subunit AcrB
LNTSQFFVEKRPIAWTALVATLVWGGFAYWTMPKRQDPVIPIRSGVIVTAYPGARAEKVEQEVTRAIERKVAENAQVDKVYSTSRQGLSIVYVDLFDTCKDAETQWQDLANRLAGMTDLPKIGSARLTPMLNKDFGETVAVMLTISSPPVTDFEIDERARSIVESLEAFRSGRPEALRSNRYSVVLVYPRSIDRAMVARLAGLLLERLRGLRLITDGSYIEPPSAGAVDFQLNAGIGEDDLRREILRWESEVIGAGLDHPDIWPGVLIKDLSGLAERLKRHPAEPYRTLNRYTYKDLREFADLIQDRIKRSSNVAKVERIGIQKEVVDLYYSGGRVSALGIDPRIVARRLDERNVNIPGGRIELSDRDLLIRPSGEFASEAEIGSVVVDVKDGRPLYLRDLCDVVRGYEDPPGVLNYQTVKVDAERPSTSRMPSDHPVHVSAGPHGGAGPLPSRYTLQTTRAVTLAIRQVKGTRIADFGRDVSEAIDSLKGILPDDLQIDWTSDEPTTVKNKIAQFDQNLIEAVVIVIAIALLFMEWRSAVLIAISIPLTIAMTLGFCQVLGIDLQQVSIAALIIALGLLVDDPVVAGDAINRELAAGTPRIRAAWLGPYRLAHAILFATLTNIVAFLPLLLVEGRVGEFIYSLPVVVTASLVSSRIVSMTFIPLLGYYLLKGQKGLDAGLSEGGRGARFARLYNGFSEWCLDHKAISIGVCLIALAAAGGAVPRIGLAFFPKDLHSIFTVNVYLPEGSPIRFTRDEAKRTIAEIDALEGKGIRAYTTFVGAGGPRFWLSITPEQRQDQYAQIMVHTTDARETAAIVERLKRSLPPRIASARVTIELLESGPPIGVPVQIRHFGDDAALLRKLGERTKRLLHAIPGVDNVHDDWEPELLQPTLEVQPEKAGLSGLTNQDVAASLDTALSGATATYLRERDQLIPVMIRVRPEERARLVDLTNFEVAGSAPGVRVPLSQISEFRTEFVPPRIGRRRHQRCLTVKCDAVGGVLPSAIVDKIAPELDREARLWPPGYRFEFGGEKYEQDKAFKSITIALIVSLIAIYLALVLQFESVTKPLVVFAAVPFGMAGGLTGLLIFGVPFGFMAFLGVASLAGVIVSHIIVLFDYIEEMRNRGESLHRAVIDAALVRLRPVLVTVLATVGGLIPLAIEGGPLWAPMCYVQIAGLLIATIVTKVITPVLYVIFVENLGLIRWEPANTKAD